MSSGVPAYRTKEYWIGVATGASLVNLIWLVPIYLFS